MKKRNFKWIATLATTTLVLPTLAIACNQTTSTSGSQTPPTDSGSVTAPTDQLKQFENAPVFTYETTYKLSYGIDDILGGNEKVLKANNTRNSIVFLNDFQMKFGTYISDLLKSKANEITQEGSSLFLSVKNLEIPHNIQVIIHGADNQELKFIASLKNGLNGVSRSLDLGVYNLSSRQAETNGYTVISDNVAFTPGANQWRHNMFENVTSIKSTVNFEYNLKYANQKTKQLENFKILTSTLRDFGASGSFEKDVTVNPAINKQPVVVNPSKFEKVNIDWANQQYIDGTVSRVSDGDTIAIKVDPNTGYHGINVANIKDPESPSIRIQGIDTPEKAAGRGNNLVLSSPFEYQFALNSSKYAEKFFPIGKKVRILVGQSKDAFSRVLGDVFISAENNDNFDVSYTAEITRAGFTFPYASEDSINALKNPNSLESLIFPGIFKAFNQAIKEQNGYFHYIGNPENLVAAQDKIYNIKTNSSWNYFLAGTSLSIEKLLKK